MSHKSREFTTRLQSAWNGRSPGSRVGLGALMLLIASLFLLFVLSPAWKTLNTDFPSYTLPLLSCDGAVRLLIFMIGHGFNGR